VSKPPHRTGPVLCTRLRPRVTGRVDTPAATELSGLVQSRKRPGVFWTHNDSGDRARIFAVAGDGKLLAEVAVTGAVNVDWEDIAAGPEGLYIGDVGDNAAARDAVTVYITPEPRLDGGPPPATTAARQLTLRYPDGPHDAEALLVDPASGAIVIVTKDFRGTGSVYVADPGSGTLRRSGKLSLGDFEAVTAGDVSSNGRIVALRTYDQAFVWSRRRGQSLASALRRRPCAASANLLDEEGQGEALALSPTGNAFYAVPEGERPALRRYTPAD
jgi:hypothetical protein